MIEITNLPIIADRFSEKDIDKTLLSTNNTGIADFIIEDIIANNLGNKIQAYTEIFSKLAEHNLNNKPIFLWVFVKGASLQVIHGEKIGSGSANMYQLVIRDNRGGLDMVYTDKEKYGLKEIQQSINTVIMDLEDISYIMLPADPTIVVNGIRKHLFSDVPTREHQFADWFVPLRDQLRVLHANARYRSFFLMFMYMNTTFEDVYGNWDHDYDIYYNDYDNLWQRYIEIINILLPRYNELDNNFILVTEEQLTNMVEINSKYERSFTADELERMAKVVDKDITITVKS